MRLEFDPVKNLKNIHERKLPFDEALNLDWENAWLIEDTRKTYGERRYIALAPIQGRLHVLCFTPIVGGIRIISFRKANQREVLHYEKQIADR